MEEFSPEWTHVRPGEFMLNKLFLWGPSIRAEGVVYEPFPGVASWPVHESDVADVAVAALLRDGYHGQAYDLSGREFVTRREQVDAIAAANADFLLGFTDYQGNRREPTSVWYPTVRAAGPRPTAERVTGLPARTFARWAGDHADEWREIGRRTASGKG